MPEISLSDFVDFVMKAGIPRATKVRQITERKPYEPAIDFWKSLRDGLRDYHKNAKTNKTALDSIVAKV